MSVFIKYIGLFWITVLFPIFTLHAQVVQSAGEGLPALRQYGLLPG